MPSFQLAGLNLDFTLRQTFFFSIFAKTKQAFRSPNVKIGDFRGMNRNKKGAWTKENQECLSVQFGRYPFPERRTDVKGCFRINLIYLTEQLSTKGVAGGPGSDSSAVLWFNSWPGTGLPLPLMSLNFISDWVQTGHSMLSLTFVLTDILIIHCANSRCTAIRSIINR